MRLEASSGKIALIVQLACVSHPFVNQNQARAVFVHQFAKNVAWTRGPFVVCLNALEGLCCFFDSTSRVAFEADKLKPQAA